jgi:glutaconate CoA-transferase subunit A
VTIVRPYEELRSTMARRNRALRDKVTSLEDAASLIKDGEHVGIGGSVISRTPMAMIWQLIRAGRKDLVISRSMMSTDGDWVIASGLSRHIITSWCAQGIMWGLSKVVRHHFEGKGAVYEEWSHLAMGMRFLAGSMALPFMPMRTTLGSGLYELQKERIHSYKCPFTGEKLALVPALNPSVAIIHVQRADKYGNAQIDGLPFMDVQLALAADRVIITTEQIVSNERFRREPDLTKIPFLCVDAVVEVPYGSAPHECFGLYEPMLDHVGKYVEKVNASPVDGMRDFFDEYVHKPKSWVAFLEKIGLPELMDATMKGRSTFNG